MNSGPPGRRAERLRAAAALVLRRPALWAWPVAAALTLRPGDFDWGSDPARLIASRFVPALVLLGLGAFIGWGRPAAAARPREGFLPATTVTVLTVAVLALSVFVRLYRLDVWPPFGLALEEDRSGSVGLGLYDLGAPWRSFLFPWSQLTEHKLTMGLVALSFHAFGVGIAQMRIPYVLATLSTPFLFMAVCRKLVTRDVVLFPLLLLSTAWWPLAYGRVADELLLPIPLQLAVLWLLLHFLETARPGAAFLLALVSGVLAYEYTAYHLAVVVIGATLAVAGARQVVRALRTKGDGGLAGLRAAAKRFAPGLAVLALTWAVLARTQFLRPEGLDWFLTGLQGHEGDATGIQAQSLRDLPAFLVSKTGASLQRLAHPEDEYMVPAPPLADPITLAFLLLCGGLAALTPCRRGHLLVAGWAGVLVGGALLVPGDGFLYRYPVAVPLLFVLGALGLEVVWERITSRTGRAILLSILAVAGVLSAGWNLHRFFGVVVPDPVLRGAWVLPRVAVAEWIRQRPREAPVVLLCPAGEEGFRGGTNVLDASWEFLVRGWNVSVTHDADGVLRLQPGSGAGEWFLVVADREERPDLAGWVRETFPSARPLETLGTPEGQRYPFRAATWKIRTPEREASR